MIPRFWKLLWAYRRGIFLQWDLVLSLVVGLVLGILPGPQNLQARYDLILATETTLVVGILGLILAGLSLLFVFLNDEMLSVLDSVDHGLAEDFFPFSFTGCLALLTTIWALCFLVLAPHEHTNWLRAGVGTSSGLFVWTAFSLLSLVRTVYQYCDLRLDRIREGKSQSPGASGPH